MIDSYNDEDSQYYDLEDVDPCDFERTVYDLNNGESCTHDAFEDKTRTVPINEMKEYSNIPKFKECCPNHGYLYPDSCEVMLFDFKFNQFFFKLHVFLYVSGSSVLCRIF